MDYKKTFDPEEQMGSGSVLDGQAPLADRRDGTVSVYYDERVPLAENVAIQRCSAPRARFTHHSSNCFRSIESLKSRTEWKQGRRSN